MLSSCCCIGFWDFFFLTEGIYLTFAGVDSYWKVTHTHMHTPRCMHTKKLDEVVTHDHDCSPASPRITCAIRGHTWSCPCISPLLPVHLLCINVLVSLLLLFMFYGLYSLHFASCPWEIKVVFSVTPLLNEKVNTKSKVLFQNLSHQWFKYKYMNK